MMLESFSDLITAYLETHLKGKASYRKQRYVAEQWMLTLSHAPTRQQIREQHLRRGHGDYQRGACFANTEMSLVRTAIRWGLYHDRWDGEDPTVGIKRWKTKKRKRVMKQEEIKKLLAHFEKAQTVTEIRDRALLGLMLFTGCRPIEARTALLGSITPYGSMGCWNKGVTKNGEEYEVPVPAQYLPWLEAWKAVRPSARPNPYLFPGQGFLDPLTEHMVVHLWRDLRLVVGLHGLWNYDLRRSLATHMSNELNYSDAKIDAILGHEKPTSLGHYLHVSFDAMCEPIQSYADWLWALRDETKGASQEPVLVSIPPAVPFPATPPPSRAVIAPPMVIDEEDKKQLHSLSERQYDILARLGQGQSCTDIAAALKISVTTVSTYRARLLDKLHLSTTPELIRYAMTHAVAVPPVTESADESGPPRLSEQEGEVLAWFVDGRTCKDLGARMGISYKTVQTYRARLMRKLQLTNTTDLIRYAIEYEADRLLPIPAQAMPSPVVTPIMPAPLPIAYRSQSVEREEWPG